MNIFVSRRKLQRPIAVFAAVAMLFSLMVAYAGPAQSQEESTTTTTEESTTTTGQSTTTTTSEPTTTTTTTEPTTTTTTSSTTTTTTTTAPTNESLTTTSEEPMVTTTSTGTLRVRTTSIDDPNHVFSYASNSNPASFDHTHDEFTDFVVSVGQSITVTQTGGIEGNWELEQIWCDGEGGTFDVDLENDRVTMTLTQAGTTGYQLRCNFDNEERANPPNSGVLVVEKHAPDDPSQVFQFTVGGTSHSLQNNERVEIRVQRDTPIEVVEHDPPGDWYLESVTCDATGGEVQKDDSDFGIVEGKDGGSITMTVTGTQFECDFDNELEGHVGDEPTPPPPPSPSTRTGGDANDEFFFYRSDGLFRFYDIKSDGSLPKPFLSGDNYTTGWDVITAIDLDGDSQDEMFFYRSDGLYRFYHINQDGTLPKPLLGGDNYTTGWDVITAVDLDGDGQDEMFFYREDGLFRFYHINADGSLPKPMLEGNNYTTGWDVITAVDLDGDGQDEFFFYREDGLFRFYHIKADGSLPRPMIEGTNYTTGWDTITAVDLDGDRQDEFFFYREDGLFRFYHINPDGSLPKPLQGGSNYTTGWDVITAIALE